MANPWFRLYAEFAHDPKVQMLSEVMQRRYIMLMCLRCSNALETLHETEIAFSLRITEEELAATKALFIEKKFIDKHWHITNWDKRQFASDSSAARVARYREKKKREQNGDVTLQKQNSNAIDTDTDTDTEKTISSPPVAAKAAKSKVAVEGFDAFWAAYPRKAGKLAAVKAYERAVTKAKAAPAVLIKAAKAYAALVSGKDQQYVAHATTWLNGGRWEDANVVDVASKLTSGQLDMMGSATGFVPMHPGAGG